MTINIIDVRNLEKSFKGAKLSRNPKKLIKNFLSGLAVLNRNLVIRKGTLQYFVFLTPDRELEDEKLMMPALHCF
ncbi:hypothetical protein GI584_22530 [Gracilibacillus salitolerans]|uniref:Uncharacterized protein n=1 Tax=Gracilibacillus salitolerans TaxID=2663022 RepID=A0A5Q2TR27_9BACI|nr:hypothetical protein [Gracilibacillus salitolerans]QGH36661.1 hypothetical protein GI584_22530 [Gracilibacillus salitolerans]